MKENNELLKYLYESCDMGISSLTNLLKELEKTENKIKDDITDELSEYERFKKRVCKLTKEPLNKNNSMTKIMAKLGIKKEVIIDNSDANVAHTIIEGLTIGIVDTETKINNYSEKVDKKIINVAKEYLEFQTNEIDKLKKYL